MRLALGPGAPDDRNWADFIDAMNTTGDQGDYLPVIGNFSLHKVEPRLKHKEDFDTWYHSVVNILRGRGLHRLINTALEKPMRNSPNAEAWMNMSMQVSAWLEYCIDPEVVRKITSRGEETTFADDFMRQCKLHMRGEGHGALSAAIIKFINTKRTEFTTASEFINVVQQRYKKANDLKAGFAPYVPMVIMISQLQETPELRTSIEIRNHEMENIKDPVKEISSMDFLKFCVDMHDKIRQCGIDGWN
ncbi:hypothetical protein N7516_009820 [Penicillium verrucosum]|uniref:uncharacterized protein n=1 Tax=Penicillium verrucosum TaxID=60171 RepID=UPI002544F400|nr:uncharacterized protein N7516_009820 [Penicillium verrucosum]KAJ5922117.1 hypothetical protein N7516_009820 [Penicillium verrucosum]